MIHIVHGEDEYLVRNNINNLIKKQFSTADYDIFHYFLQEETLNNIITTAQTTNLFARNKVLIIEDNENLVVKFANNNLLATLYNCSSQVMIIIKLLTNSLKDIKDNVNFNVIKVKTLTKVQLQSLIKKVSKNFNINISNEALIFMINYLPSNVNIFLNELTKLRFVNEENITLPTIKSILPPYQAAIEVFTLSEYLLAKDYKNFWLKFNYYKIVNYDKINIVNILVYQFEMLRNIKILIKHNQNFNDIAQQLKIPYFQIKKMVQYSWTVNDINNILLKLAELDYNIKSGKSDKNLAIDLFFLNI